MFLQWKSLKGGGWGKVNFLPRAPFLLESISPVRDGTRKSKGTQGKISKADNWGRQCCPSRGEVGDSIKSHSAQLGAAAVWRSLVLTAKAFPEPTPARVLSVRFFFPILSVSCFTPHPPILVWLSHCLVSLILDRKHSGAGNTSFYSQEAVLLWHYMHN